MFLGGAETIDDLLSCFCGVVILFSIYSSVLYITTVGDRTRVPHYKTTLSRSPCEWETPKPSEVMEQHGNASSPALPPTREGE